MVDPRRLPPGLVGDLALLGASGAGLLVTLWAALAAAPAAPRPVAAQGEAIGRLLSGSHDVRRRFDRALVWNRVTSGAPLFDRDAVYVGADSAATIRFEDGSQLEVEESSLIVVSRPPETVAAGGVMTVDIRRGGASGSAAGAGLALRAGEVAAKLAEGTAAVVRVDAQRETRVAVSRGAATIARGGRVRGTVGAGQRRTIGADGEVGEAKTVALQLLTPAAGARALVGPTRQKVAFAWEPLAGRGPYLLEVAGDVDFRAVVARRSTQESVVEHPPLPPGVYFWRVSRLVGDERASSLERRLVIVDDYPPVPYRPLPDAVVDLSQETALVIAWGAVPDVRHYRVELARGRAFSTPLLAARVDGTFWRLRPDEVRLEEGGHCLRVRADGADRAESPWCEPVCFRIVTKPVLRAPEVYEPVRDFRPPSGEKGSWLWRLVGSVAHAAEPSKAVTLRWERLLGAARYGIEIGEDAELTRVIVRDEVAENAYRFVPPARQVYYFRVRGVDAEGRAGLWSSARPVAIELPPPVWAAPTPGQRFAFGAKPPEIGLRWQAAEGVQSFLVEIAADEQFGAVLLAQPTAAAELLYRPVGVGAVFVRVAGVLGDGSRTGWSAPLGLVVFPEPPRGLTPRDGSQVAPEAGRLLFRWSARPVSSYELVVATDPQLEKLLARRTTKQPAAELPLTHVGPIVWRVRAAAPASEWSGAMTATVLPATPVLDRPTTEEPLRAALPATVSFAWGAVAGAERYELELCTPPLAGSACATQTSDAAGIELPLASAGEWRWRVRAGSGPLWSAWTSARPLLILAREEGVSSSPPPPPPTVTVSPPPPRWIVGALAGWRHNLGAGHGPELTGELSYAVQLLGHPVAARLRLGYGTAGAEIDAGRLRAAARVHQLPIGLWADYGGQLLAIDWWAGLGLLGETTIAVVAADGQPTLREDRFGLGVGVHCGAEWPLGWGVIVGELSASAAGRNGTIVVASPRGIALSVGYRMALATASPPLRAAEEEGR